jgi:hypothetical protein
VPGPLLATTQIVFVGEQAVVKWQSHRVESEFFSVLDVVSGDETVLVVFPKSPRLIGSDQIGEEIEKLGRAIVRLDPHRVSLRLEPKAKIHAAQLKNLAIGGDEVAPPYANEVTLGSAADWDR